MSLERDLKKRSNECCELCNSTEKLTVVAVEPIKEKTVDEHIYTCTTCASQIAKPDSMDANHWRCLNDSMWSEHESVKVMVWRLLQRLNAEGWPKDLIETMYMEDDSLLWAKALGDGVEENKIIHRDANGLTLNSGDSVVLIKDLAVKGSSMIAKRGTAVRRISLDHDNAEYIEGKIDGQQIVIVTKYVKKT